MIATRRHNLTIDQELSERLEGLLRKTLVRVSMSQMVSQVVELALKIADVYIIDQKCCTYLDIVSTLNQVCKDLTENESYQLHLEKRGMNEKEANEKEKE